MYCSSNIREITPPDWQDDPIMFVQTNVNGLFNDYNEIFRILNYLYLYLEEYDEINNKKIPN